MDVASCPSTTDNSSLQFAYSSPGELRFPVAAADGSIGDLVDYSTMHTHVDHDEESLAGSTYEFVDTDVESRDGHTTASIASTDVGRPDDVASLADTDQSDEESADEEDNSEPSASIPTASRSLEQTSVLETPTIGRSSAAFYDDPHTRSIEFEELFSTGAETVSVKHTVQEFGEEMTKNTVQQLNLRNAPQHLSLTIRQTMTRSGLTTKDPLRVLFVGSHAARQDIVTKIGSCLSASNHQISGYSQSQLYNVVPISASAEEVELMQSSGIQIKVEDCIIAESMPFEDNAEKPDIIKLRLDDTTVYHSVPDGNSFIVEPSWELPHVAVFYCSNSDTSRAKQTRSLTRRFMTRHGVPSLVITHQIILDRSLCLSLDQHAVHMCLEERNPEGGGNIIRHRLPIDLTSFLNIDARQMSRNLAYVTGLSEVSEKTKFRNLRMPSRTTDLVPDSRKNRKINDTRDFLSIQNYQHILPLGMLLLSILVAVFTSLPAYSWLSSPAISVNSQVVHPISISQTTQVSTISTPSGVVLSSTQQVVLTSTKTVKATQSPRPHSLSIPPTKEVRVVPVVSPESLQPKKCACSAEVIGRREILIRVPSSAKLRWLSREAISVNISRDHLTVNAERVYSSDEGIVVLLKEREAYGLLDLSIGTTKKPNIKENIQVDFGSTHSQAVENIKSKIYSMIVNDVTLKQARQVLEDFADHALLKVSQAGDVTEDLMQKVSTSGSDFVKSAKTTSFQLLKRTSKLSNDVASKTEGFVISTANSLKQLEEPAQKVLLRAQVQSKLAWLKMLGRDVEYEDYKRRASEAVSGQKRFGKRCRKSTNRQR